MSTSRRNLVSNEWEMSTIERKYSVPDGPGQQHQQHQQHQQPGVTPGMGDMQPARGDRGSTSEDLHAWSIYRQNLNSDFTDSALGSSEKSPLPYGNFQLRESTVHSILSHPRYGPKSALSSNMYTYLKFGLPRVFPPSRGRDGSSGYNSSDDGSPGPNKGGQGRGPTRTRSEMDFRNLHLQSSYSRQPPQQRNGRMSNSEANLLSVGQYYQQEHPRTRRSVAAMERSYRPSEHRNTEHRKSFHDLRSAAMMDNSTFQRNLTGQRRASKAGSHMSLSHRKLIHSSVPDFAAAAVATARSQSAMGHVPYYGPPVQAEVGPFQYPHLQVRNLEIESAKEKGRYLVQGVTFEVRGGELLSVMSTQAEEGTALLAALSGSRRRCRGLGKITAELVLNGNLIDRRQLVKRSAFVDLDTTWDLDLTVRQTLFFHYRLRRVTTRFAKVPLDDRVSSLIEDLGLDQVSGTKLSGLTQSELRRLSVAVHLLMDVDLLFLDQPTKGMDIFDTFFLIEYLRQWCLNASMPDMTGRAVIISLQPPTYEILTMISRLLILSNGHVMYTGVTSMLLSYFTSVEYPCPSYKNPSDYYLDLVTLDDLSAEAMLESSQRMAQLGELQRRRQEPLSDPGPPVALPPVLRHANIFQQAGTLFLRSLVWSQPSSFIRYLFYIILAAILSFSVGAIFWDIPSTDTQLLQEDRLGFHHTVLCVAHWPLLLVVSLSAVRRERKFVLNEITNQLYSATTYIIVKVLCSLPGHFIMWMSYLVPAYIMSGLHYQGNHTESTKTFYLYVSLCLIYLHALQLLATALSWLFHKTAVALVFISLIFTVSFMFSGYPLHVNDAGGANSIGGHLRMASPTWWVTSTLLQRELRQDAFKNHNHVCRNKQKPRPEIIVQIACPTPNGTAELDYQSMLPQRLDFMGRYNDHSDNAYIVLGVFWLSSLILLWLLFCISTKIPRKRKKINRSTNKP